MVAPIVIMAGGTGGHVFPALAVAEQLRDQGQTVVWFGTRAGLEADLVPKAGFEIEWLSIQGLRGKGMMTLVLAPFRLLRACWQAFRVLSRRRPRAVLGMGGFVAGPGGLVAWLMRIPLILHEQNSIIGLTNRLLVPLARRSYFAFPEAANRARRSECIGNPVRDSLFAVPAPGQRLTARIDTPLRLLVIGGSLGAAALNRVVPEALAQLTTAVDVRHQCGGKHLESCQQNYQKAGVEAEVVPFIDDMASAYAWADLVVCRAGALTVSELAATGSASILIPYPYAVDNHQYFNASHLQQQGAAEIIRESELSTDVLAERLSHWATHRDELIVMAEQASALGKPQATEDLVQGILAEATP